MGTPTHGAQPNPVPIFETMVAYQRGQVLKGALDLDLFTAIGKGRKTAQEIAQKLNAAERGVRILCDFLAVDGLLVKSGDAYENTLDAAVFLNRESPAYLGEARRFLMSPMLAGHFNDVAAAVRKGETVSDQGTVSHENPVWLDFARGMAGLVAMPAEMVAAQLAPSPEPMKVLDIAAGHGFWGLMIAKRNPQAQVTALDWKSVLTVAQENAEKMGLADRFRQLPGSAFEVDYGGDYDVILLPNFLHHFTPDTCVSILKKVHAALKPGGRIAIIEFVPNPDRVSPPMAAKFSMIMLCSTPGGDAYTESQLRDMLSQAGFSGVEANLLPPTESTLVVAKK